jgi:flagellar biosynthesis anti-sigma factor FlgM
MYAIHGVARLSANARCEKKLKHSDRDSDKLANAQPPDEIRSEGGFDMAQVNRADALNEALSVLRQKKIQTNRNEQLPAAVNANPRAANGRVDEFVPSSDINEVNRLREEVNRLPDIDEEKVAQLREAIRNGTFTVDSHKISEKILAAGIHLNPR